MISFVLVCSLYNWLYCSCRCRFVLLRKFLFLFGWFERVWKFVWRLCGYSLCWFVLIWLIWLFMCYVMGRLVKCWFVWVSMLLLVCSCCFWFLMCCGWWLILRKVRFGKCVLVNWLFFWWMFLMVSGCMVILNRLFWLLVWSLVCCVWIMLVVILLRLCSVCWFVLLLILISYWLGDCVWVCWWWCGWRWLMLG